MKFLVKLDLLEPGDEDGDNLQDVMDEITDLIQEGAEGIYSYKVLSAEDVSEG